jgi:hypothetical protein
MMPRKRKLRRVALYGLLFGIGLGMFGLVAVACYVNYMVTPHPVEDAGDWAYTLLYLAVGCLYASPVCLLVALVTWIVSLFVSNGPDEGWKDPIA